MRQIRKTRRLLVLAAAFLLLGSSAAHGGEGSLFNTSIGGDVWLRGYYKRNVTDAAGDRYDKAHYLQGRFRLDFETVFAERARAHLSVDFMNSELSGINGPLYSGDSLLDGDDRGFYTFGSTPFGAANTVVGVREAWLQVEFPYNVVLKGGRTSFRLGNGIVLDQPQDMLLLTWRLNRLSLGLGYGKIWDTQGGSSLWAFANLSRGTTYRFDQDSISDSRPYPENPQVRSLVDDVADRLSSNDTDAFYLTVDFDVSETTGGGLFGAFLNDQESFAAGFFLDNEHLINKTGLRVGVAGALFHTRAWGIEWRGETDFLFGDVNIGSRAFDVDADDVGIEDPFEEYVGSKIFGWNIFLEGYQPLAWGRVGVAFGRGLGDGQRRVAPKRIGQIGSDFQLMNILTDEISPFGLSNLTILKSFVEVRPLPSLLFKLSVASAWREGTGVNDPDTSIDEGGSWLGFETDAGLVYEFTDYATFYLDTGWLVPGSGIEAMGWQYNRQDANDDGRVDANDVPRADDLAVELTTGVRVRL